MLSKRSTIALAAGLTALSTSPVLAKAESPDKQRAIVAGINVLGNGFLCGTVAAYEGRNVLKDAAKCMLGGTIQYAGMEVGMRNEPFVPGIGLRIVETGTSMIENTLKGDSLFEQLSYEAGPMLFHFKPAKKEFDWEWRVLPIGAATLNIASGYDISFSDTLNYQTPFFKTERILDGSHGYAIANVAVYKDGEFSDRAHEFDHVLQYTRMRPLNLALPEKPLLKKLHMRLGEDIGMTVLNIPQTLCGLEKECSLYWLSPHEMEAHTMQEIYDSQNGDTE